MTHTTAPPSRLLAFMLHVFQCMTANIVPLQTEKLCLTEHFTIYHRHNCSACIEICDYKDMKVTSQN